MKNDVMIQRDRDLTNAPPGSVVFHKADRMAGFHKPFEE
jgi:hypothetical protein